MAEQYPKTIDELKAYCANEGMPLEKMRFFIGEDYREARAFGIYQDEDGSFVVYKNKADGSRAVRYQGPDEAYAVKELYEKLQSEIELRRNKQGSESSGAKTTTVLQGLGILAAICAVIAGLSIGAGALGQWIHRDKPRGYYQHQSQTYYYDYHDWYIYDSVLRSWSQWDVKEDWTEEPKDYYVSWKYDDSYGVEDFKDSEYYKESSSSGSDYSSWDSNDTNWDSDW